MVIAMAGVMTYSGRSIGGSTLPLIDRPAQDNTKDELMSEIAPDPDSSINHIPASTSPTTNPPTEPLSTLAIQILDLLLANPYVANPIPRLIHQLSATSPTSPTPILPSDFDTAINQLITSELAAQWNVDIGTPGFRRYAGPILTLTHLSAYRADLRLNANGSRWLPRSVKDQSERYDAESFNGEQEIVTETDLLVDPPGTLDDEPDVRTRNPVDAMIDGEESRLQALKVGGLIRPTYLVGTGEVWPVAYQDRGPWAPETNPEDNPRNEINVPEIPLRIKQKNRIPIIDSCPVWFGINGTTWFSLIDDRYSEERKIPAAFRKAVAKSKERSLTSERKWMKEQEKSVKEQEERDREERERNGENGSSEKWERNGRDERQDKYQMGMMSEKVVVSIRMRIRAMKREKKEEERREEEEKERQELQGSRELEEQTIRIGDNERIAS